MTPQEIFTKVKNHLLTQKAKSIGEDDNGEEYCMYRDPQGRSCAVGCLIPDEVYKKKFEGKSVTSLIEFLDEDNEVESGLLTLLDSNEPLLTDLQNIHDQEIVGLWDKYLQVVAQKYNLEY